MLSTIIIGLIFAAILFFAGKKAFSNIKNNKCNCGTSCSDKEQMPCYKKLT